MLILARELATNAATPMFIADADGTLVFYNEPAERILGRSFAAAGEIVASEWETLFRVKHELATTAFPLFKRGRDFVGVVVLFWE